MDDDRFRPLEPTRDALHALRDREALARLELEECRREREAMAVWMLQDGASVRTMRDMLGLTHNRLAVLRRACGAYPPAEEDRAAKIRRIAHEVGTENVAIVARRAGASLGYTYRVLNPSGPPDALALAKMNGARVRDRLTAAA